MTNSPLAHHFYTMACNNAWSNHRLLTACCKLSQADLAAARVSFFPSIKATLNHNLIVDWYYVDALELGLRGAAVTREVAAAAPLDTCAAIAAEQRAVDARLVALCATLTDTQLTQTIALQRRTGVIPENTTRLLAHLFQHQIHHRGQTHAMLAGTSIAPPQLDEFFCTNEAHLRAAELAEIGLSETQIWDSGARHR